MPFKLLYTLWLLFWAANPAVGALEYASIWLGTSARKSWNTCNWHGAFLINNFRVIYYFSAKYKYIPRCDQTSELDGALRRLLVLVTEAEKVNEATLRGGLKGPQVG